MKTLSNTKSLQRFGNFLLTLFFGIVSYTTLTGDLQNLIHFAGSLNEMVFFCLTSTISLVFATLTLID
jgi:hypothetical protein